ncbi:hypothetical protein TNCV_906361 [Trichonephila clavipes]|nr:hypothetical protein TNCV_906361 [Trichonephila clavipes]
MTGPIMRGLLLGHVKSLAFETSYPSVEDLIARTLVAAGRMRDMPGILQNSYVAVVDRRGEPVAQRIPPHHGGGLTVLGGH